jgi:protein-S-isoprenylcysteine O-methyltransferase Ste14
MKISYTLVFLQFFCLALLFLPINVHVHPYGWILMSLCISLAFILLLWTARHNRLGNFNIVPEIKEGCELIITGPYRFIRHPMYTSVTLIGLGILLYGFALWKIPLFILLIIVLYFKASREEAFWCEKTEAYRKFQEGTKMFIPFIL